MLYKWLKSNKIFLFVIIFISLIAIYPNAELIKTLPTIPKLLFRVFFISLVYILFIELYLKKLHFDNMLIVTFLLVIYQVAATLIFKGDYASVLYQNTFIGLAAFIFVKIFIDIDILSFSYISFIYFFILAAINFSFAFFIDYKSNLRSWFFGNRNNFFEYYFPLIFIEEMLTNFELKLRDNKSLSKSQILRKIVVCVIVLISTYLGGSLTSFICLFIIYSALFFYYFIPVNDKSNLFKFGFNCLFYFYLLIIIFIFILIILPGSNSLIMQIVSSILGKSTTASGRSFIYDNVVNLIVNRPFINNIFGSGLLSVVKYMEITACEFNPIGFPSTHNIFLMIFLEFGLIGSLIYVLQLKLVFDLIIKMKNKYKFFIMTCIFAFFLRGMFESNLNWVYLFFLGLIYYYSLKIKNSNGL